jgi:hypothetical protein
MPKKYMLPLGGSEYSTVHTGHCTRFKQIILHNNQLQFLNN